MGRISGRVSGAFIIVNVSGEACFILHEAGFRLEKNGAIFCSLVTFEKRQGVLQEIPYHYTRS